MGIIQKFETDYLESVHRVNYFTNKKLVENFQASEDAKMFEVKLNKFADFNKWQMTQMKGLKLLARSSAHLLNSPEEQMFLERILNDTSIEVPEELDWRKVDGRVTAVKDQGQCGSCWAFAATGVLEGQTVRNSSAKLVPLSEQNIIDCDTTDSGCNGGLPKYALRFVHDKGGVDDQDSYPYEATRGRCRFNKNKVAFTDKGAGVLSIGDEQKLKEVVAKFGPVAVGIDALNPFFFAYHKGVYVSHFCGSDESSLDHAVLVVGYGTDKEKATTGL